MAKVEIIECDICASQESSKYYEYLGDHYCDNDECKLLLLAYLEKNEEFKKIVTIINQ